MVDSQLVSRREAWMLDPRRSIQATKKEVIPRASNRVEAAIANVDIYDEFIDDSNAELLYDAQGAGSALSSISGHSSGITGMSSVSPLSTQEDVEDPSHPANIPQDNSRGDTNITSGMQSLEIEEPPSVPTSPAGSTTLPDADAEPCFIDINSIFNLLSAVLDVIAASETKHMTK